MSAGLSLCGARRIVLIGAHPDDIELGAGGLLLSLAAATPGLRVHYILLTGSQQRHAEARTAAAAFLPGAELTFALHSLPDGRLPGHWLQVKNHLHEAAAAAAFDLVICHDAQDAHQDHRLLGELAPTVFRHAQTLHYEIPKWDGDFGRPNLYLPLTDEVARRKVALLHSAYDSQKHHDWWDDEVFLGLARRRGMECRSRYAEAFYCGKAVVTIPGSPVPSRPSTER
ncbi:MAG: PIG-L family deacetylase [Micromonosporaceae bacterium]|nr:PIG-L family deacetylase [Micromonosporaceae bacterium]